MTLHIPIVVILNDDMNEQLHITHGLCFPGIHGDPVSAISGKITLGGYPHNLFAYVDYRLWHMPFLWISKSIT